jgi:hypothetical protein
MKQIFTFTLLILAIGLAAFEYDVIDELPMGNVYEGEFLTCIEYPYMYASSRYGLKILEINSIDGSLSQVSSLTIPGSSRSIQKIGDYLFLLQLQSHFYPSFEPAEIFKIDVSDPVNPFIEMSREINPEYRPSSLNTLGPALMFRNMTEIGSQTISLVDPETLLTIAEVMHYYGYSKINETTAIALVDVEEQLYTIRDFSDPYNSYEIGTIVLDATEEYGGSFYRWDDNHILHMHYNELHMYEVNGLFEWNLVSIVPMPSVYYDANPLHLGDRLLLSSGASIQVVNYSDLSNPVYEENFLPDPSYWYPGFNFATITCWNDNIYGSTYFHGLLQLEMGSSGLEITDAFCPKYPFNYYPIKFDDTLISVSCGKGVDTFLIEESGISYLERLLPGYKIAAAYQWQDDVLMLDFVQDVDRCLGFFRYENSYLTPLIIHPINNTCDTVVNKEEADIVYLYDYVTSVISRCRITATYDLEYLYQYTSHHDLMFGLQFHDSYLYGVDDLYNFCVIGGLPDNAGYEEAYLEHPFGEDVPFSHWILDDVMLIAYSGFSAPNRLYTFNGPSDFEYHSDEQYYMDGLPPSRKGDYLYLPGWYSLHVYDITDYDNPVHLGYIPLNSHYQDIVFYEENGVEKAIIQQAECLTMVTIQPTEAGEPTLPVVECTLGNYPNPFNPSTEIRFQLSDASQLEHTQIEIFNIKGQMVKAIDVTLSLSKCNAESKDLSYSTTWDGTDSNGTPVAGGVYLYQLKADGKALGQSKMLLLK